MKKKTELGAIFQRAEDYYYGQNGKKSDTAKALELYRQAAEQGHIEAQFALGAALKMPGEYKNTREAVKWLHKAAEQGHQEAQYELGHSYEFGIGVEINLQEADKWYRMGEEEEPEEEYDAVEIEARNEKRRQEEKENQFWLYFAYAAVLIAAVVTTIWY